LLCAICIARASEPSEVEEDTVSLVIVHVPSNNISPSLLLAFSLFSSLKIESSLYYIVAAFENDKERPSLIVLFAVGGGSSVWLVLVIAVRRSRVGYYNVTSLSSSRRAKGRC
jgi:hypothetical protein